MGRGREELAYEEVGPSSEATAQFDAPPQTGQHDMGLFNSLLVKYAVVAKETHCRW